MEQIYSDESLGQQHPTCDQVILNIYQPIIDSPVLMLMNISKTRNWLMLQAKNLKCPEGKEARKVSPMQDQIEASSKTESKVINSDNTKQPNQIGRPVKVAIVGDSMIKYVNPSKLRKSIKQNVHVQTFPGAK